MDDKRKIEILRKYTSRLIDRNQENTKTLLNIGQDTLLEVLQIKRDSLYFDLINLNDGKYMDRNDLIHLIDDFIEAHKALYPTQTDKAVK